MKKGLFSKIDREVIISGILGILVFFCLFGFSSLSILDFRLFSSGDPGGHYLGWRLFRESPWQLFPGLMNGADYPFSVSVIFTDSLPLAAVFFKVFRGILPKSFNYLGLWTLFCFFMQGAVAALIIKLYLPEKAKRIRPAVLMGALMFLITPAFIRRAFWHTALTSHFLILFSLYLFFGRDRVFKDTGRAVMTVMWGILGFLSGSVHLYFLGFCGLIALSYGIDEWRRSDAGAKAILGPAAFGIVGLVTVWILGAFDSGMASGAPGFGFYSFNLNGFINGDSWSLFLNFPYYEGAQMEGFAYLGIGVLALVLISLISSLKRAGKKKGVIDNSILPAAAFLFITSLLIAVSGDITFFDKLLFSFDLSDAGFIRDAADIFRSSGRFAWIGMYLLMIGGIAGVCRLGTENRKANKAAVDRKDGSEGAKESSGGQQTGRGEGGVDYRLVSTVMAICLMLQIIDISPGLVHRARDVRGTEEADLELCDDLWQELADKKQYKHLIFLNKHDMSQEELYTLAYYAVENNMTINDFNFARALEADTVKTAEANARQPSKDSIYILTGNRGAETLRYPYIRFRAADGLFVGVKEE